MYFEVCSNTRIFWIYFGGFLSFFFGTVPNSVDGSEIRQSPVDMVNVPIFCSNFIHFGWCFGISEPSTNTQGMVYLPYIYPPKLPKCIVNTPYIECLGNRISTIFNEKCHIDSFKGPPFSSGDPVS